DQQFLVNRDGGVVDLHDAGVVDQHVELRVVRDESGGDGGDAGRVLNVKLDPPHAGIGAGDLSEVPFSSTGDDHLIAAFVECFGQAAADAGSATGDQDRVAREFHVFAPFLL